ncbi:hypothetical protein [Tabrizicola fusiformis]|uniref:hypothetical protein n=1 Tax=Tabrizicola sp. SY72 TaxID=2741673 RepID=UPI001571E1BF|nr:hypothetical protein [Tabrizicola sp. SY72]NTT88575.1 hypothetical protein [Tabrizicola sp. SY72]
MAVLTFPLSLAQFYDLLPISKAELDQPEALDLSQTTGGEVLTADLGTSLWSGRIELGVMTHDEVSAIRPLINILRRAGTSFLVSDPTRPWPRLDPNGTVLGAATPTILAIGGSGRELSLTGLPAAYPISRGDLMSFTYGSPTRYALHEVVGAAVANGAGETGLIEVNPPIRPGASAGAAVQLIWPRCKARLVPGQNATGITSHTITSEAKLAWTQTLR